MKNIFRYVFFLALLILFNAKASAQNFIDDANDVSLLPVKFISFTATHQQNSIKLNWSTSVEVNNSHFNILRSVSGIDFVKIATVKGNGTTTLQSVYNYTDQAFPQQTVYYKLQQVDYNGQSFSSSTIKVEIINSQVLQATVYPNPVLNKNVKIHLSGSETGRLSVAVKTMSGNIVYTGTIEKQGNGMYSIQLPNYLSSNMYFLEILHAKNKTSIVQKIVIQ